MEALQGQDEVGHGSIEGQEIHGRDGPHGLTEDHEPHVEIGLGDPPAEPAKEEAGPERRLPLRQGAQDDGEAADDQEGQRHLDKVEDGPGPLSPQDHIQQTHYGQSDQAHRNALTEEAEEQHR